MSTDEFCDQPMGAEMPVPMFFGSGPTQFWTQSRQFDALQFGRCSLSNTRQQIAIAEYRLTGMGIR